MLVLLTFYTCTKPNMNFPGYYRCPGVGRFDGAPGVMIIHTSGSKKKDSAAENTLEEDDVAMDVEDALAEEIVINPMYFEGLRKNTDTIANPLGVDVRTSSKGSMEKKIFLDFSNHFIRSLPKDQGKDKEPAFLCLDGHSSRSNLQACINLMMNNTWTFFLPSHTSIWSQPNDAGTNRRLHGCIEKSVQKVRRGTNTATVTYLNSCLREALELFIESEHRLLQASGPSSVSACTSSCQTWLCGLHFPVQECEMIQAFILIRHVYLHVNWPANSTGQTTLLD